MVLEEKLDEVHLDDLGSFPVWEANKASHVSTELEYGVFPETTSSGVV